MQFEYPAWTYVSEWVRESQQFQRVYEKSYESYTKAWMSVYADIYLMDESTDKILRLVCADLKADDILSVPEYGSADHLDSVEQQAELCAWRQARADMLAYHKASHEIYVMVRARKLKTKFSL
jgi:hypothetical protein